MSQFEASSFNSWALGTFAVPGEGNLMIRVFRGMGKSIPTHGGIFFSSWPIGSVAKGAHKFSFVLYLKVYLFIYLFIFMVLALNTWRCCVFNKTDTVRWFNWYVGEKFWKAMNVWNAVIKVGELFRKLICCMTRRKAVHSVWRVSVISSALHESFVVLIRIFSSHLKFFWGQLKTF